MMFLAALLVSLVIQQGGPEDIVITNVSVIDVVSGTRLRGRAVTISKGRIVSVRPTGEVEAEVEGRRVDGSGAFLIPGLWDMHAEVVAHSERDFPLLIANGVTGVRNMQGSDTETLEDVVALKTAIEAGQRVGPRIVAGGALVGPPELGRPQHSPPKDAAAAREAVRRMASGGADFLEVTRTLSPDVYFNAVQEAASLRLPTAGQLPWQVRVAEASAAGQSCFDALFKVFMGCCDQEHKVTARLADYEQALERGSSEAGRLWAFYLKGFDSTFEAARREQLLTTFVRNRTWQCPLLRWNRFCVEPGALEFKDDETHAYVQVAVRSEWRDEQDALLLALSLTNAQDNQSYFRRQQDLVRDMQRSGVGVLAGSGLGHPFVVAGFGLHDELEALVAAGLTPAEALRSATLAAARYLGRESELGSVAAGKLADLVLLDADPLADITNTRAIRAVVVRGRLFERGNLDEFLGQARRLSER